MELKHAITFFLVLIALVIPVALSFRKPLYFYPKLKYFIPAAIFSGTIFILWLMRFAEIGIWAYNPEYFLGIQILRLPVEEWLFLLALSFGSVYGYEWVKLKLRSTVNSNLFVAFSLVLLIGFALLAYFGRDRLYTFFTFFLLTIYFGYTFFRNRFKKHYFTFYFTYILLVLPFAALKIIFVALPVIIYNPQHILGIRLLQVPVEDFGYLFLLLLINVTIFEYLSERRFY